MISIWVQCNGPPVKVDEARTEEEATYLATEYQVSYGHRWAVWAGRKDKQPKQPRRPMRRLTGWSYV
jgi:hypothetical protein